VIDDTGASPLATNESNVAKSSSDGNAAATYVLDPSKPGSDESSSYLAKEELNLLAKLIGSSETSEKSRDTFKLNLFDKDVGCATATGQDKTG
jgi:hypothetical protein